MRKFSFIVTALILFVCFGQVSAQKRKKVSTPKKTEAFITSSDVKIEEDKFSGKRKVYLAKQKITSVLTLELDETIDLDAPTKTAQQWSSVYVSIKFTFHGNGNVTFISGEVNFIVDGERVKGGDVRYSSGSLSDELSQREFFIGVITVSNLEKIANGSEVQMKLGDKVYEIDKFARKNIKAFIAAIKGRTIKKTRAKSITTKEMLNNPNNQTAVTTASGLTYIITKRGEGAQVKAGDNVIVNYTGLLTNGTKFDSSLDRGEPFSFPLGAGRVIKGWDEGVQKLRVGDHATLVIPPAIGYGSRGAGGAIPPNATLIFIIEVVGVK